MPQHSPSFFAKPRVSVLANGLLNILFIIVMNTNPSLRGGLTLLSCLLDMAIAENSDLGITQLFNDPHPTQKDFIKIYGTARYFLIIGQLLLNLEKAQSNASELLMLTRMSMMTCFIVGEEYRRKIQGQQPER